MPVKKVLKVLKNKVKASAFKKTDDMDRALEEFDDYINLGIKPAPLQGPDLKPASKTKKLREPITMSVEERTGGLLKEGRDYKTGPKGEYISLKNEKYKKNRIAERRKLSDKINDKTATKDEIEAMDMIEEMDVGYKKGGMVKKGFPKLAKKGWK
jgi:hypothetical protein